MFHFQMASIATSIKKIECENYEKLPSEAREFLQSFYSQLVHQPITFTAHGFYVINRALLAAISTTIISYEIILVQFYSSYF